MKKVLEALVAMQSKMSIETILLVLLVSLIISLIIYFTYKNTYSGVLYNSRFNVSLIMITLITTIVMIVIGSNISVSLGMVGALSIIRFRTAVKDPRDTAFIFWAVVSGLSCGTQNYSVVLIGSFLICIILFIFKTVSTRDDKYMLIVKGDSFNITELENILNTHKIKNKCKGKYITHNNIETIYDIKCKETLHNDLIKKIHTIKGIDMINIVASNTDTMG